MHFYAKFSFQKKVWEIAWKLEYCISAKLQTSNRHINPQMRLLKKKKKTPQTAPPGRITPTGEYDKAVTDVQLITTAD